MNNIFLISDTHFGHSNALTFKNEDGTMLRPFSSVEEMDEHMVKQWNKTVSHDDLVYHLGDVVMNKKHLHIVHRLNGRKVLIRGNHDQAPIREYLEYFDEVWGTFNLKGMLLSHMPVDKKSVIQRYDACVHGHLHNGVINDPVYFNVGVERLDYTPISLEELKLKLKLKFK